MSTAVASIDYEPISQIMTVTFTDGSNYLYWNVPQDVYADFVNAGSLGEHFNAYIRNVGYSYRGSTRGYSEADLDI